ncbi:NAD(P)H-quinone oxidoreductase [Rheinheimera marina]|uniref:NAD(P)H-quinone oxidoreductase n=1 Tax=Rheinheimera marina TaxID=1774958 RepID=A0ABV9JQH1_9GAMM
MENLSIPAQMRCIEVKDPGQSSTLQLSERAVPALQAGQVLVKVAAAGVNRADLLQRQGLYPPPPGESDILGLEVAGTVVAVADTEQQHWLGQQVFGLVPGGGYAEYVALPAEHLMKKPAQWSFSEAAACAEVFLTAFQAMTQVGDLPAQGRLLVHAGASGVGTAAIQLGKLFGATVAVTVGSAEKARACLALGADFAINYREQDFVAELKQQLGAGFNLIIDPVAADYLNKDLQLLALDGQIVVLSMLGGRYAKELDMALMLKKRGQLLCSTLRNRTDAYKAQLVQRFIERCGDNLGEKLQPVVAQSFRFTEAEQAHRLLQSNAVVGKLMLCWE